MQTRFRYMFLPPILALLTLAFWLGLAASLPISARAQSGGAVHADGEAVYYVAPDGICNGNTPCYATVQAAVDAADDPADEVWIASGIYTGVNSYGGLSQVVYINKSVTLRGGYNADFSAWDPALYTTTLNAQSNGRVIYATGPGITVTFEGLDIYDGYALDTPKGSGVYLTQVSATITNCTFRENGHSTGFQNRGGGLYLSGGSALIAHNAFYNNQAEFGGALSIESATGVTLRGNHIHHNLAYRTYGSRGGGIYAYNSPYLVLEDNDIFANQARPSYASQGGGISLVESDYAWLENNRIYNNEVRLGTYDGPTNYWRGGGGLDLWNSDHVLITANQIYSNTVWGAYRSHPQGGGVRVEGGAYLTFTHNTLYGNAARGSGSTTSVGHGGGMYTKDIADSQIAHNDVYSNTSSHHGGGFYLAGDRFTITANQIYDNSGGAQYPMALAGGLYVYATDSLIYANEIHHNDVQDNGGGGVHLNGSGNLFAGNTVYANSTTGNGGGVQTSLGSNNILRDNLIISNTAANMGGGVHTNGSNAWVNNVIADNAAGGPGAALSVQGASSRFWHNTLARNDGPSAIYVYENGTAVFTNTLVVSASVGLEVQSGNTAVATTTITLWDSVLTPTVGLVNNFGDISGTAALAADGYHLSAASDALDAGIATAISKDVDGQPRAMNNAPDIGADEYAYQADLSLGKSGPASGNAGAPLLYTISVMNAPTAEVAADVLILDTVEPAAALGEMRATVPGGACSVDGASLTCNLYNITIGAERLVTVWLTPTAEYNGVLTNTAAVYTQNAIDPNPDNNTDAVATDIIYQPPAPILWLEKHVSAAFAEPGDTLVYSLTWGNSGSAPALQGILSDTLPVGVSFVSANPSQSVGPNPLVWNIGEIAPGAQETYILTVTIHEGLADGTVLTNTALLAAGALTATDTAITTVYEQAAGMSASKSVINLAGSEPVALPGDFLHYTLLITNTGPIPIRPTLADPLPAGTQYNGDHPPFASRGNLYFDPNQQAFLWEDVTPLQPAESVQIALTLEVIACGGIECGLIRNLADIQEPDYPYLNRTLQADAVIQCPDLAVTAESDVFVTYRPEDNPYHDLGVYNATVIYGNVDHGEHSLAAAGRLTLRLPAPPDGAWFESADPPPTEQVSGNQWVWDLAEMPPGGSDQINLVISPENWRADGYALEAEIEALPPDVFHPALECEECQANNEDVAVTYPAGLRLNKQVSQNRWLVYADPYNPTEVHHEYQLDYYVTYHYRSALPALPPVTTLGLVDHFPAGLNLGVHLSQPLLNYEAGVSGSDHLWTSPTPLQVDDGGWLRMRGVTELITPGMRLTNTLHGSAVGDGFVFERVARAIAEVPLFAPLITYPQEGEACPGSLEVRGVAPIGTKVTLFWGSEVGNGVPLAYDIPVDSGGNFATTLDNLPDSATGNGIWAKAHIGELLQPGYQESAASPIVWLTLPPQGGHWCPQRSHWDVTVQSGPLAGSSLSFQFRNGSGQLSTQGWQIPEIPGFENSLLYLKTCCADPSQVYTVTVNGVSYRRDGAGSNGYHIFAIGEVSSLRIETRCGEETQSSSDIIPPLIDPDGYVFNVDKGGQYDPAMGGLFNPVEAISGVTVTAYVSMPQWGGWVPWPAHLYGQVNPQVTDEAYPDGITTTGYYAFFTPPGFYYLQVDGIEGYQAWRSPVVEVITQVVHVNVPYTPWSEQVRAQVQLTPNSSNLPTVTIETGQTVEWLAQMRPTDTITNLIAWSENPLLRPLSNLNPLADIRGFDAGYLSPGQAYRRTFLWPGTYTYQVNGHTGQVIVTGDPPYRYIYLPLILRTTP